MRLDPVFLSVVSDLFTNLSAGWFGVALIFPIRTQKSGKIKLGLLTLDVILGILFLIFAYQIRKYG